MSIDNQSVKTNTLYLLLILDQKSSGSKPDGTTDNQTLTSYKCRCFFFVTKFLLGFEGFLTHIAALGL
jgi:hypothetical protein